MIGVRGLALIVLLGAVFSEPETYKGWVILNSTTQTSVANLSDFERSARYVKALSASLVISDELKTNMRVNNDAGNGLRKPWVLFSRSRIWVIFLSPVRIFNIEQQEIGESIAIKEKELNCLYIFVCLFLSKIWDTEQVLLAIWAAKENIAIFIEVQEAISFLHESLCLSLPNAILYSIR